jgi:hypothetical protein
MDPMQQWRIAATIFYAFAIEIKTFKARRRGRELFGTVESENEHNVTQWE